MRRYLSLPLAVTAVMWMLMAPPAQATPAANAIWGWGANTYGMIGDGTTTDSNAPVATVMSGAMSGQTITQISAGSETACALTSAGHVYCWGVGTTGQLGNGVNANSLTPVAVDTTGALAGKTVAEIQVYRSDSACARTTDGQIACWGGNTFGELGDGTNTDSSIPRALDTSAIPGRTFTMLRGASFSHACAIMDNGQVACWGNNVRSQLGNGTTTSSNKPVPVDWSGVLAGKTAVAIASGTFTTCIITNTHQLACWGSGFYGTLGNGTLGADSNVPVLVTMSGYLNGKIPSIIEGGDDTMCTILTSGEGSCWGYDVFHQFGDGLSADSSVPVAALNSGVLAGKTLASMSIGYHHACGVTTDGLLSCWGANLAGSFGTGSAASPVTPVAVLTTGALRNATISGVATSDFNSYAFGVSGLSSYDPQAPPDVMQQLGTTESGNCSSVDRPDLNWAGVSAGGWTLSWSEWPNEHTGGFVCTRTLFYHSDAERWMIRR